MRNLYFLLIAMLLTATPGLAQTAWRIEPGKYIGNTLLGTTLDAITTQLGRADGGDAAMGKAWSIWYSRHKADNNIDSTRYLAVYSVREETNGKEAMIVRQIRINTPSFTTAKGIKVGSSYIEVKKTFPAIREVAKYEDKLRKMRIVLYDVRSSGIAFEMTADGNERETCTAITIHPRGENIDTYILFPGYEGFKRL